MSWDALLQPLDLSATMIRKDMGTATKTIALLFGVTSPDQNHPYPSASPYAFAHHDCLVLRTALSVIGCADIKILTRESGTAATVDNVTDALRHVGDELPEDEATFVIIAFFGHMFKESDETGAHVVLEDGTLPVESFASVGMNPVQRRLVLIDGSHGGPPLWNGSRSCGKIPPGTLALASRPDFNGSLLLKIMQAMVKLGEQLSPVSVKALLPEISPYCFLSPQHSAITNIVWATGDAARNLVTSTHSFAFKVSFPISKHVESQRAMVLLRRNVPTFMVHQQQPTSRRVILSVDGISPMEDPIPLLRRFCINHGLPQSSNVQEDGHGRFTIAVPDDSFRLFERNVQEGMPFNDEKTATVRSISVGYMYEGTTILRDYVHLDALSRDHVSEPNSGMTMEMVTTPTRDDTTIEALAVTKEALAQVLESARSRAPSPSHTPQEESKTPIQQSPVDEELYRQQRQASPFPSSSAASLAGEYTMQPQTPTAPICAIHKPEKVVPSAHHAFERDRTPVHQVMHQDVENNYIQSKYNDDSHETRRTVLEHETRLLDLESRSATFNSRFSHCDAEVESLVHRSQYHEQRIEKSEEMLARYESLVIDLQAKLLGMESRINGVEARAAIKVATPPPAPAPSPPLFEKSGAFQRFHDEVMREVFDLHEKFDKLSKTCSSSLLLAENKNSTDIISKSNGMGVSAAAAAKEVHYHSNVGPALDLEEIMAHFAAHCAEFATISDVNDAYKKTQETIRQLGHDTTTRLKRTEELMGHTSEINATHIDNLEQSVRSARDDLHEMRRLVNSQKRESSEVMDTFHAALRQYQAEAASITLRVDHMSSVMDSPDMLFECIEKKILTHTAAALKEHELSMPSLVDPEAFARLCTHMQQMDTKLTVQERDFQELADQLASASKRNRELISDVSKNVTAELRTTIGALERRVDSTENFMYNDGMGMKHHDERIGKLEEAVPALRRSISTISSECTEHATHLNEYKLDISKQVSGLSSAVSRCDIVARAAQDEAVSATGQVDELTDKFTDFMNSTVEELLTHQNRKLDQVENRFNENVQLHLQSIESRVQRSLLTMSTESVKSTASSGEMKYLESRLREVESTIDARFERSRESMQLTLEKELSRLERELRGSVTRVERDVRDSIKQTERDVDVVEEDVLQLRASLVDFEKHLKECDKKTEKVSATTESRLREFAAVCDSIETVVHDVAERKFKALGNRVSSQFNEEMVSIDKKFDEMNHKLNERFRYNSDTLQDVSADFSEQMEVLVANLKTSIDKGMVKHTNTIEQKISAIDGIVSEHIREGVRQFERTISQIERRATDSLNERGLELEASVSKKISEVEPMFEALLNLRFPELEGTLDKRLDSAEERISTVLTEKVSEQISTTSTELEAMFKNSIEVRATQFEYDIVMRIAEVKDRISEHLSSEKHHAETVPVESEEKFQQHIDAKMGDAEVALKELLLHNDHQEEIKAFQSLIEAQLGEFSERLSAEEQKTSASVSEVTVRQQVSDEETRSLFQNMEKQISELFEKVALRFSETEDKQSKLIGAIEQKLDGSVQEKVAAAVRAQETGHTEETHQQEKS
eukprot:PhM_4_TR1316/c0_g1_i1/m.2639